MSCNVSFKSYFGASFEASFKPSFKAYFNAYFQASSKASFNAYFEVHVEASLKVVYLKLGSGGCRICTEYAKTVAIYRERSKNRKRSLCS